MLVSLFGSVSQSIGITYILGLPVCLFANVVHLIGQLAKQNAKRLVHLSYLAGNIL